MSLLFKIFLKIQIGIVFSPSLRIYSLFSNYLSLISLIWTNFPTGNACMPADYSPHCFICHLNYWNLYLGRDLPPSPLRQAVKEFSINVLLRNVFAQICACSFLCKIKEVIVSLKQRHAKKSTVRKSYTILCRVNI